MRKMNFKTFQLIIGEDHPTASDLKKVADTGKFVFNTKTELFEVQNRFVEDRFFWMSCYYENRELYRDHVWNADSNELEDNPRTKSQIECKKQLFVCFDTGENVLYISDDKKKGFVGKYLNDVLQKKVQIKNIYRSIDEFVETVRYLREVTFVQTRNLMNSTPESIFSQTVNIYGLDIPEKMRLKVEYGGTPIGYLQEKLYDIKRKLNSSEYENVVLVGIDDAGMEQKFNFSTMIKSVAIKAEKDENGYFQTDEVKMLLLNEIR